ncbi:glutamine amidotransferase-related protein, partial [Bacillus cereus]
LMDSGYSLADIDLIVPHQASGPAMRLIRKKLGVDEERFMTILRLSPDGIMLSNGPGDPKDVPEAIEMLKDIIGKVPLFGICL